MEKLKKFFKNREFPKPITILLLYLIMSKTLSKSGRIGCMPYYKGSNKLRFFIILNRIIMLYCPYDFNKGGAAPPAKSAFRLLVRSLKIKI